MSAAKTNSLLVNNAASLAGSTRGTATGLYRPAKTEKLVFPAIFASKRESLGFVRGEFRSWTKNFGSKRAC
jgi:hypothetical protein